MSTFSKKSKIKGPIYRTSAIEIDETSSEMALFTDIGHLHFNVLIPNEKGMESMPIAFIEGVKGEELKKGMIVEKDRQALFN